MQEYQRITVHSHDRFRGWLQGAEFAPAYITTTSGAVLVARGLTPTRSRGRGPGFGHGQLHRSLHDDPRVTSIEGVNAATSHPLDDVIAWLGNQAGWRVDDAVPSPTLGGDGNHEFLLGAQRR
ncbi:MAG: hypothetical protein ACTSYE_04255 [Alphaproteobacteria bacterium]